MGLVIGTGGSGGGSVSLKAVIAWDGASVPVPANIPAGVQVTYNGTTYTGTLAASSSTKKCMYLVKSGSSGLNVYDEYVSLQLSDGTWFWEEIGCKVDLSAYLQKAVPTAEQGTKEYLYSFAGETQNTDIAVVNDMSNGPECYTDKMVPTAKSVALVEASRTTAEAARVAAEQIRQTNEATRQTNETARQTAHNLRQDVLLGVDDAEEFSATKRYLAGTYCLHDYTDSTTQVTKKYLWRFTATHEIGAWTGDDVIMTSVVRELSSLLTDDYEHAYIEITSSDGLLTVSGIQIQVTFQDGSASQTVTTDSNGKASLNVVKDKYYTLTFPLQSGYQSVPAATFRASLNSRYINIVYQKTATGTTTQTVNFTTDSRGGTAPAWNGTSCNLVLTNGTETLARTATIANNQAVFSDVPVGYTGTITSGRFSGWVRPNAATVNTNISNSVTMTYSLVVATGIFMVRNDGVETTYENWDTSDTCVAIHVATTDLVENNADYYIKIENLNTSSLTQKVWQTNNTGSWYLLPNVPVWNQSTPYYDGETATANMISDSATYEETSPAAEQAVAQTFTLRGITANGYILTRDQMQPMIDSKTLIYDMAALVGVTANYYTSIMWTSSQYVANTSWDWRSGSWSINGKTDPYFVLPAYAI